TAKTALILGLLLFSLLALGCTQPNPVTPSPTPQASVAPTVTLRASVAPTIIPVQTGSADTKTDLIAEFVNAYAYKAPEVTPQIPAYSLPLSEAQIYNFGNVTEKLGLSAAQKQLLLKNGFVVIPDGKQEFMANVYGRIKNEDVPIFVTTDSLLHYYHIQFDDTLREIEETQFYAELKDSAKAMLDASLAQYEKSDGLAKQAALKNAAFVAVGLALLDNATQPPELVAEKVNAELALIAKHEGFAPSPIFVYKEDYSQYVPRGHYTRSETLKKYFKAMMWFGRITFLAKGGCDDCLVSAEEANLQTTAAALIAITMDETKVGSEGKSVRAVWDRIYGITTFFVGLADDLTPLEYKTAIQNVAKSGAFELNEKNIFDLRKEIAGTRLPKIFGGTGGGEGACGVDVTREFDGEAALQECLAVTQGMRFMGQRFVPDAYVFQQLIFSAVDASTTKNNGFSTCEGSGHRCFGRGLDVMSVLGSQRAEEILKEENDASYDDVGSHTYDSQLAKLKTEFAAFSEADWKQNLYWTWLDTLKPLLTKFGAGYPSFMQTTAWQDKELNAALASWAQLRHDTILYVKQPYAMQETSIRIPPKVVGYVEPVPEFYARLSALTRMTKNGLKKMNALPLESEARLDALAKTIDKLEALSEKELRNEALAQDEYDFIRDFDGTLDYITSGTTEESKKTTIVADVQTDLNSELVVEEGTGYVDLMVVAYKTPEGAILAGAGPVFSYYEFKQPMSDRLTDEAWRTMLDENAPNAPEFTKTFK
ncbi:MAG: DUF3160 domain-containing protein, partial [Candidatus Micrarchaeota archaeon]